MPLVLTLLPVVVRRAMANGRLLAAVVIGAVLAAALMATTAIYTDAIRDLGLTYALRQRGPDNLNISIDLTSQSSQAEAYARSRDTVLSGAETALGPVLDSDPTVEGRSATFFPTLPGQPVSPDENRNRAHLQFVTNLEPHIRIVEGRMPADAAPGDSNRPPSVEVAVGAPTAQRLNVRVGDRFELHPFWRLESPPVAVTVVGIIEPVNLSDPYWLRESDLFDYPRASWDTLPFFVTEQTFVGAISAYLPTMISDYKLKLYVDTGPLNARNATAVSEAVLAYQRQIGQQIERVSFQTQLPDVLQTFDQKLFFTRIPLLVLVIQIDGIVLYYLFMVSTMLIERQTGEIALFKSRGATTSQVMLIYIVEGLVVFLVSLALGPPLAATVISLLGHTPPFADLSGNSNLAVHLTSTAYLLAAVGAGLAYAALLWPAYQATKRTVVQDRGARARPPKQPTFTRYYLDLVLVGVGAGLFYQLNRRGSLVTDRLFGEQTVDPVQLLTPAFFIVTVGLVFLRIFPLALRIVAWLVSRAQGTALVIGVWHLVRNPVHYSRLILLLMLATAVGMFSASFGATVSQSYSDRASYQSGADIRLSGIRTSTATGPVTLAESVAQEIGATNATAIVRTEASFGETFQRRDLDMLGVDPEAFGDISYFRGDFAGDSLDSLLSDLKDAGGAPGGPALADDARWLGMWVNALDLRGRVGIEVRLRDSTGRYFAFNVGPDNGLEFTPGWVFLIADLSRPAQPDPGVQFAGRTPTGPFSIESISVRFLTRVSVQSGTIRIDDVQTSAGGPPPPIATARIFENQARSSNPFPDAKMVADFESGAGWEPLQGVLTDLLRDEARTVPAGTGGNAIELQWRPVQGQPSTHGLRPAGSSAPLPALASDAFLAEAELSVGDTVRVGLSSASTDLQIVGSYRLFPTLGDGRTTPSVVVDSRRLMDTMNPIARVGTLYPDEVWLSGDAAAAAKARESLDVGQLSGTLVSFEELRAAQQRDPLVEAGWEGILFIGFAAILILSALGFLIYSYLTAQRRTLEFAVLRTMGFSKKQIAIVVGFEQTFVIGLGMFAGTLMGLRLGALMIGYMGVTETGDQVLPPMLLHVSWITLATAWLTLGLAFLVTIGIVVLLYSRLALHRVLRIGET